MDIDRYLAESGCGSPCAPANLDCTTRWRLLTERRVYWTVSVVVALMPAIIMLVLLAGVAGVATSALAPLLNDEYWHWHQIRTFAVTGFSGGYYTWNENPAALSFIHFGFWGPGFPLLYGSVARLVGWETSSALWYNLVAVTGALMLFCGVNRLSYRQLGLTAAVVATFWPLYHYLPTTMQTALHIAIAIAMAARFAPLVRGTGGCGSGWPSGRSSRSPH